MSDCQLVRKMRSFPNDWEAECITESDRITETLTPVHIFFPSFSMEPSFVSIGGKHNQKILWHIFSLKMILFLFDLYLPLSLYLVLTKLK